MNDSDNEIQQVRNLFDDPVRDESSEDEDTQSSASNPFDSALFKLALYLNSPSVEDIRVLANNDPVVIFRCYILNADQKEKFMFMKKIELAEFTKDKIWGHTLSLNFIFNEKNKFIIEKSLTFVVLVSIYKFPKFSYNLIALLILQISIHNRKKQEAQIHSYPHEFFFKNSLYSDFTIVCNDREIPVHRNVLHTASPVFATMFQAPMSEAENKEAVIDDIEGNVVLEVIRYIYTGNVKNLRLKAMDLLNAAEKYELFDLKQKCIDSLSLHLNVKNIFKSLILADRHNEEIFLRNCIGFIKM